jgi:hypothetical protein
MNYFTLKMEETNSPEILVTIYQNTVIVVTALRT